MGVSLLASARHNVNYDESKVPTYTLPDVFTAPYSNEKATNAKEWEEKVRPAIVKEVEKLYTPLPERCPLEFKCLERTYDALDNLATREQWRVTAKTDKGEFSFNYLYYRPNKVKTKIPVILGFNFCGNHTVIDDKAVILTDNWIRNRKGVIENNKAAESQRGKMSFRWNVRKILERGYAFVALYYGDVYPDSYRPKERVDSIYKIMKQEGGALSAWAWGAMAIIDNLCNNPAIDKDKIVVIGHSRLGKTALLTGVYDTRVAVAISNDSGCMGAAISRRCYGETVELITRGFPYWFSKEIMKYKNNESAMPIDQHQLMAAIAPRAVYVASAVDDKWADPKGEFLGLKEASKVYKFYGADKFPEDSDFQLEKQFIGKNFGYHMRAGGHNLQKEDWNYYFKFLDTIFKK